MLKRGRKSMAGMCVSVCVESVSAGSLNEKLIDCVLQLVMDNAKCTAQLPIRKADLFGFLYSN